MCLSRMPPLFTRMSMRPNSAYRRVDDALDVVHIPHVAGDRQSAATGGLDLGGQGLQPVLAPGGEDDRCALSWRTVLPCPHPGRNWLR